MLRLSASAIKTYFASPAKWAWQYILGIKDDYSNDSLTLGKLFEKWLMTSEDDWSISEGVEIDDKEKFIKSYDALKHNSIGMDFEKGKTNVEVKWILFDVPFIWYIDNLSDERIDDIKTTQYLSNKDWSKNMWSGMSYYEEYELQLFLYMLATGRKKARILEVSKHEYKDKRKAHQIIEFHWTEERKDKMLTKLEPIVQEMKKLYDKFGSQHNKDK